MATHRITSIRFSRYKAFENFQISLQEFNVLVGPNNAGKSTVIGAFRILAEGLRKARSKNAEPVNINGLTGWGHRLNLATLPIAAENIFFDYDDSSPAQVVFRLSNGNHLKLYFPEQGACYLIPESSKRAPRTPSQFKSDFDIEIGFVPILGPVEQKERLYEKEAARLALLTSGASRNFRNIWYHFPEEFEQFQELVRTTWPGMDIDKPNVVSGTRELVMFCPEERHPREICWSGYGFQVWCQMLTFIVKAKSASTLVIDEPDIYLHSDLQRQLVSLLRELGPDILLATHSTEIIAECEPSSLLNINKKRTSAQRVKDASQLKRVFSTLGSNLNPTLTQLAKTRRVLFVEGLDFQILSAFARTLGRQRVANRADFAVIQIEGFNPKRAVDLAGGIDAAIGARASRAVILDKDYRCAEEVGDIAKELRKSEFRVHIHARKELENYLLDARAIARAVDVRIAEKARRSGERQRPPPDIDVILQEALEEFRHHTFAQTQAREAEFRRKKAPHLDQATITEEISARFSSEWSSIEGKISLAPGKEVLTKINARLQEAVGISVSDNQIAHQIRAHEIHPDIQTLVDVIYEFSSSNTAE